MRRKNEIEGKSRELIFFSSTFLDDGFGVLYVQANQKNKKTIFDLYVFFSWGGQVSLVPWKAPACRRAAAVVLFHLYQQVVGVGNHTHVCSGSQVLHCCPPPFRQRPYVPTYSSTIHIMRDFYSLLSATLVYGRVVHTTAVQPGVTPEVSSSSRTSCRKRLHVHLLCGALDTKNPQISNFGPEKLPVTPPRASGLAGVGHGENNQTLTKGVEIMLVQFRWGVAVCRAYMHMRSRE